MKIQIKFTATVELPSLPNYIKCKDALWTWVPVQDLSPEQLREIGAAWTDALMKHAEDRRKPTRGL